METYYVWIFQLKKKKDSAEWYWNCANAYETYIIKYCTKPHSACLELTYCWNIHETLDFWT
jgi:hypothetical protein